MIREGKNGSLNFYFENKFVGSLSLGGSQGKSIKDYYDTRDKLLREALEDMKTVSKRDFWCASQSGQDGLFFINLY